ncbi:MAG TPA: YihY/virulence factor BrkB family protein [Candidatus Tyrphobacter sp.]
MKRSFDAPKVWMQRLFSIIRRAAHGFAHDGCTFLAQALAFNAIFALFPLAVLILSAISLVIPDADRRTLLFLGTLAPTLHDFIVANLRTYIYGRGISSLIALAVLLWSGKNLFMGVTLALDRALGVPVGRPFMNHLALSLVMLPISGLLLIVAVGLPVLFAIFMQIARIPDWANMTHVAAYVVSILLVFSVSLVMYALLPNRRVSLRFALPGAAFVAIAWPVVQYAFAQYTLHVNFTRIYGVLSAPLALLLWFYIIAAIFLYGAELCGVRDRSAGT